MTYPAKASRCLQFSATRTNRASRRRQSVNHKHIWWRDDWFSRKLGGKPLHFNNTKIMKTILRALVVCFLSGIGSALPAADAFDGLNVDLGNLYRVSNAQSRSIGPESFTGDLYVADSPNNRIQELSPTGAFLV